ncbi:MAG: hypothetical protein JNM50_09090 [Chromatiales bacterium]|nr:hypothetical protein [Chromatiales bacterium]
MTLACRSRCLPAGLLGLLLALTTGCLSIPAAVREEARPAPPPAPNHFRGPAADSLPATADTFLPASPAPIAPGSGRWPPPRDGLLRRAEVPADVAWPPPLVPRHGQVVASEQGSAQGLLLSLFSAEPHLFVHTGLVAHEAGEVVVYETQGVLRAEIGGTPAKRISGGVRRVPWDEFAREQRFIAVFEPPPGLDVERAVAYARDRIGAPFDPLFDAREDGRLYCTELTARALAAGGWTAQPVELTTNPSLQQVMGWLGIGASEIYSPGSIVGPLEQVAIFSRHHSPPQLTAYFAAKLELYRRFTPDQRLGNVIAYSPVRGLSLRQPVQDFLAAVNAAAPDWPATAGPADPELARRVRQLASTYLGAFPDAADGA